MHRIIENAVRRIVKEYGEDAPVDQIVGADDWDGDEDEAIENNSFDNLPQSIRDKYTIKDYICYYDFTEERKRETQAFIQAKIEDIEMFEDNKNWWEPKEITPYTSFYCQNLCRSSQSL